MIKTFPKFFEADHMWSDNFCKIHNIERYKINDNGLIDVDENVSLIYYNLKRIPVKFGIIDGDFILKYNSLRSLDGSPERVNGMFNCSENLLTSLVGSPKYVEGYFNCSHNLITSFEGFPDIVGGIIDFSHNPIDEVFQIGKSQIFISFMNEYNVIRGNGLWGHKNLIVESRLRQALEDSDIDVPSKFNFKNYKLI